MDTTIPLRDPRSHKVAAFILFFSVLLLIEGTTRVNLHIIPGGPWGGTHTMFPPVVALIGGIGEMIFSFFGLVVAYYVLCHGMATSMVVYALMACELLFGWFVFAVYVLAMPSFAAARLTEPMPNLSLAASRAVILMGLTGSIAVCAALQGGQFMFTNILLGFITGKGKQQTGRLNQARLFFFAFLVLLKGVSEIVIGTIIQVHQGAGLLASPVVEPPFVVTHSQLLIADGVFVTLVGLIGLAVAALRMHTAGVAFSGLCLFTLLVQLGLYDVGSVGLAAPAVPVGCLQVGLTVALMVMPAYLGAHLGPEEMPASGAGKTMNGNDVHAEPGMA